MRSCTAQRSALQGAASRLSAADPLAAPARTATAGARAAATTQHHDRPSLQQQAHFSSRAAVQAAASGVGAAGGGAAPNRQVRVRHILLRPENVGQAEELAACIASGELAFAEAAAAHSACPSGRTGGDLGWLGRGRTVPEFEAAAFSTPVGEMATATTQFGIHILLVEAERAAAAVRQMSVEELGERLAAAAVDGGGSVQLVDVREEREAELAALPGFQLLPLSRFQEWAPTITQLLDPSKETICLCHHGVRSMQMAHFLVDQGFGGVWNVTGGIDAYSRAVDSRVPLY
eukprot:scaffold2.g7001.t1